MRKDETESIGARSAEKTLSSTAQALGSRSSAMNVLKNSPEWSQVILVHIQKLIEQVASLATQVELAGEKVEQVIETLEANVIERHDANHSQAEVAYGLHGRTTTRFQTKSLELRSAKKESDLILAMHTIKEQVAMLATKEDTAKLKAEVEETRIKVMMHLNKNTEEQNLVKGAEVSTNKAIILHSEDETSRQGADMETLAKQAEALYAKAEAKLGGMAAIHKYKEMSQVLKDEVNRRRGKAVPWRHDIITHHLGLERLIALGRDIIKPIFDSLVKKIAKKFDAKAMLAPVKGPQRSGVKVRTRYGGDASQLSDIVRATLSFEMGPNAVGRMYAAVEEMVYLSELNGIRASVTFFR